jgi:long-subunit acyl-CoA synthetase (AMP-forming)
MLISVPYALCVVANRVEIVEWHADIIWRIKGANAVSTLQNAFTLFSARPCLGERHVTLNGRAEGPFRWQTFGEIAKQVEEFGSGLRNALMLPALSCVGICAPNSTSWIVTYLACVWMVCFFAVELN